MSFTHLHLHTSYSLLDGAGKIPEMIMRAKELGQKSIAITDHGVMYGVMQFYVNAIKLGIKPIIGCEVYVTNESRFDRISNEEKYHLILLCENEIGYKNLIKIVSCGFVDGFYVKPRVDYETLNKYHEGLICLSACLAGEVPKELSKGDYNKAILAAKKHIDIFGKDNYFIEIQNHGLAKEIEIQPQLIKLANELDLKLVATNDVHYTLKEDWFAHDCLLCVQTAKKVSDSDRIRYEGNNYHITSEDEMKEKFKFCLEAVENTQIIADRCNMKFEITKNYFQSIVEGIDKNISDNKITKEEDMRDMLLTMPYHMPKFEIPDGYDNVSYLKYLVDCGIKDRFSIVTDEIKHRVEYELNVIISMGFTDYFLIVWDYIHFAKENNIPVGPGRGSSVGSLVAYALKITNINPLEFGLFFERFLNPERVSMPDIDTDFCKIRRDEVIEYVKQKYGKSHVAQIVTYGTLASRQVVKDMGRVMEVPNDEMTEYAKLIPRMASLDDVLNKNIDSFGADDKPKVIEFRRIYNSNEKMKIVVDTALRLEDIPRQNSTHASGVLIAPDDVEKYVPLSLTKDGAITTEFTMVELEELGLLKMDFLGLRNLSAIQDCIELIKENHNEIIDLDKLTFDDENIFKMISEGDTLGIFQLESPGMTNFMKRLKPNRLEDLIVGISLYRPGPMDFIPKYIDGKNNKDSITYDCNELESILSQTYGCIVYQEQVMQIVQELAGFSLGRADLMRRAMSKKDPKKLMAERQNFIYGNEELKVDGCLKRGIKEDIANKIYDEMADFAEYAFNKSHAAAYAVVAYQTAYLKYYYEIEFYTSICNSVITKRDDLLSYISALNDRGINILRPDVNLSDNNFKTEGNNIRMGLIALKGIGQSVANEILTERNENGPFVDFCSTLERFNLRGINKKAIENLIYCGAFDDFYGNRNQKMHSYYKILKKDVDKNKELYGSSLFDYFEINNENSYTDEKLMSDIKDMKEINEADKLRLEKDISGLYISGHPLNEYKAFIDKYINIKSTDLYMDENEELRGSIEDGDRVRILGIINEVKIREKRTKYANIVLEDLYGTFNIVLFQKQIEMHEDILEKNRIVFIEGKIQIRADRVEILTDNIRELDKVLWIQFENEANYEKDKTDINELFNDNIGSSNVCIYIKESKKIIKLDNKININETMINILKNKYNEDNVKITYK